MPRIARKSPSPRRRSPRRSARRSARRSPRRSPRRSARRSAHRSPRRSPRRSAHRLHGGEMDAVLAGGKRRSPRHSPRRAASPRREFVHVQHAPRMVVSDLPLTLREICVQAEDIESGKLKVELREVVRRIDLLKKYAASLGITGVYPETMVNLCSRISEYLNKPWVTEYSRIQQQNSMLAGGKHKSPRRSARKSPRRSARKSPRRSARKSPRRSARKSPRRSARKSPRRSARKSPRRSARKSPRRSARKSPRRSPRLAAKRHH